MFAFMVISLLAVWIAATEVAREKDARDRLELVSAALADRITIAINSSTSTLYALGELALAQDGHIERLPAIARDIRSVHENILNLAIMPDGVVQQMEPIEGNEPAIGHDMFADPNREAEAWLARETGEMTVTGPYDLIQGGRGVIARLPLYEKDRFWGFVSIVYMFPGYLDSLGFRQLDQQGIRFKLINVPDGPEEKAEIILASDERPLSDPVIKPVQLPNNLWELQLVYATGFNSVLLLKLIGAVLGFALSVFVFNRILVAITEQRRLEASLAKKNGEFVSRHSAQRRMLARIAHDLRSPLQGLLNEARAIARGDLAEHVSARSIEQSVRYQLRLIYQLLEHSSRAESGSESSKEPQYLFGFIHEVEEQAKVLARGNDNRLVVRVDPGVPDVVELDFHALQQVLLNLLGNAAKFCENGEIGLRVRCRKVAERRVELTFEVKDTGSGIDGDDLVDLQRAFRRAEGSAGQTGSGLGLYIVSDLLRRMDSQLEYAAGAEGLGSVFHFTLEALVRDVDDVEAAYIESHVFDWDGNGRKLLIVDDSPSVREGLAELMLGYDCDVDSLKGGQAALDALGEHQYDLVICEQHFERLSLADLLKANRNSPVPAPVLVYASRPLDEQDAGNGVDAIVLKPATTSHLLSVTDRLWGRSKHQR